MTVNFSDPILVVHPSTTQRNLTKRMLAAIGFSQIKEATSGNAAVEILKTVSCQSIVSAWSMADGDGKLLLELIRSGSVVPSTLPVIIVFDQSSPSVINGAAMAGMTAYVVSPFDQSSLKKAMVKGLGVF